MKRRSQLSGTVRLCSVVVKGEQCEGPVDAEQAKRTLLKYGEVLCGGHEHARHAAKVDPVAEAFRERMAKRKALEEANG